MQETAMPAIPGLDDEEVSTLLNVRTYRQYCQYVEDKLRGKCPFCDLDTNLNKVICDIALNTESEWRIWHNPFPQKYCKTHLIIAPARHILRASQMMSDDWSHMTYLINFALNTVNLESDGMRMGLPGGGILIRFGDPMLNAGSIRHIHANIIVPDGTGEVRIPLAKDPEDARRKMPIISVFEKMRLGTPYESLTPDEKGLVIDRME